MDDPWVSFPSDDADVWTIGAVKCIPVDNSPIAVACAIFWLDRHIFGECDRSMIGDVVSKGEN